MSKAFSVASLNGRVCAVVVTFNRKELLRECLTALKAQTRAADEVLVVDNASTDGTLKMLEAEFAWCRVLALPENVGGAGGFHDGMEHAYKGGFDWLWLMDDDGRPAADCLEKLLEHARPNSVMFPVQQDRDGKLYGFNVWRKRFVDITDEIMAQKKPVSGEFLISFVGPLVAREVVEKAGLPNKDFFIWLDDCEYSLRAKIKAGAEIIAVPDALFYHDFFGKQKEVSFLGRRSMRNDQAAWKIYYGARNQLYIIKTIRRRPQELLAYFMQQARFLAGEVMYEPDRWQRAKLRLLGIRDGALGRLGKRN